MKAIANLKNASPQLFDEQTTIRVNTRPHWCEEDLWRSLTETSAGQPGPIEVAFFRSERKVFRKRRPIAVSAWAEKHRVLTMSALPGIWRNEVTPYLSGIMDASGLPFVREVTICAVPQSGKTETAHNFIGWCIDRAPGPVMYIYPDETAAKENANDRIIPMIQASPRLRSYFTGKDRDASSLRISLQHMPIYLAWARSASRLANKPIKYAIADEIDKEGFDPGKKEAHPLDLIDKRFNTYRATYKFFKISTPTLESGNIWKSLLQSDMVFDFHVKCPLCGLMLLMDFEHIKWEGGSKADRREILNKRLAWYECHHCQGRWDDELRNQAVRHGVWLARGMPLSLSVYLEKFRPASIGFHIPAWISFFVSLSESAHAFLKGLDEGPLAMQDFQNAFAALPWKESVGLNQEEEQILAHKTHLPAGVVPADAVALTCGIDVQTHGFWFLVKAWKKDLSSHRVQYGWVTTWEDITDIVHNTRYPVEGEANKTMGIWRAALDTGGGPAGSDDDWSKTEEIYEWLRKNGRNTAFGIKGASRPQIKKVTPRVIDKMSRKNRVIKGGLTLYFLDTAQFKEAFWWRMGRKFKEDAAGPAESQHITLNADTGLDYVRQILAEEKQRDRKTGKVAWVPISRDNHLLDCEVYSDACADPEWMPSLSMLIRRLEKEETPARSGRKIISKGVS